MAGQGISINVSGSGTTDNGDDEQKNISKWLKEIAGVLKKSSALQRAGLGGGGGLSGLLKGGLGSLVGGIGAGAVGLAGFDLFKLLFPYEDASGFENYGQGQGSSSSFASVFVDQGKGRERMIAEIDDATGEIVDLLTIEEAQQRNILDSNERVRNSLESNADLLGQLEDLYGLYRGELDLTNVWQKEITTLNKNQADIVREINELLAKERDAIAERSTSFVDESRFTEVRGSRGELQGYRDEAARQSVGTHTAAARSYLNSAIIQESNSQSIADESRLTSGPARATPWVDILNSGMKESSR